MTAPDRTEPALAVAGLAVARGGIVILRGVSFAVARGEAVVLRGPNGIGKTSLLRTIAGLAPPAAGTIAAPADGFAYAGHLDGMKGTLTVAENLTLWARVFRAGGIAPALQAMNLDALARRPAASLSAGQRRRLGLARLLVTGRPVWLLDEPTVSLDEASVALFAAVLARHLAQGGAALAASHADLGLPGLRTIDLTPHRATAAAAAADGRDAGEFG